MSRICRGIPLHIIGGPSDSTLYVTRYAGCGSIDRLAVGEIRLGMVVS